MRRIFSQVLLLLMIYSASYAQKKVGGVIPTDTNGLKTYIDKLNHDANELYVSCPDSARKLAEQALLLSEKIKYNKGIGESFLNLGHVYWSQSYYPISLFYLKSALTYIPKNEGKLLANCYNATGRTYMELKNFADAGKNIELSAKYANDDILLQGKNYSEKALLYTRIKDYDKALEASLKALTFDRAAKDDGEINIIYTRLGSIYRFKNQIPKALAYNDSAYRMSFKTGNKRLRAKMYVEYADVYNQLKQYDNAIIWAQKGASLADSIGLMDGISGAYRTMMFAYEQKKDLGTALAYQKKYSAALDKLNTTDKQRNTELIQNYFALNARLNEIAIMQQMGREDKARISFQNAIIVTLSVSLVVVLLALYVTWYNYKQKKQLNTKLGRQHEALLVQKGLIEDQSANLAAVNKLKDKLLAVIGHDLRTPFANLRNIISLFENDSLDLEDMQGLMRKMGPVIKGGELTLNNLLEWAGSQIRGINVTPAAIDINLIGDEMAQTYNYALLQKNIRFQNVAITGHCVKADEKHVKVVIGNLISNAIKFTDDNGIITLSSAVTNTELVINVNDTGKGIAEEQLPKLFNLNSHFTQNGTMGEVGTGIGLFLCKELVEFNGGRLWVTSTLNQGSTFSFSLPLAG
ncbi:tetratricopeptide repeat-containing sensor histidine kinase [Mucilaginibacter flavus]|uniref:tetratricopeptide repeat-containing sensor histidine kinase n=1 Tax=Mucilaginibacter flavus TaxID=931504 RepID=UPI0025B51C1B|nr:tetratricopeptide repeat-containing sensor histidine kinase [Mucilaginibacter flavus]MDN3579253.1 tetratricopeptide repeat-containing sensor histidine kinase [Mucilaginibacter flavus]